MVIILDNLEYNENVLEFYNNAVVDFLRLYQEDIEDSTMIPRYLVSSKETEIILTEIRAFLEKDRYGTYKINEEEIAKYKEMYPTLSDYLIMQNLKVKRVMEAILWNAICTAIDNGYIAITTIDIIKALSFLSQFNIPPEAIMSLRNGIQNEFKKLVKNNDQGKIVTYIPGSRIQ